VLVPYSTVSRQLVALAYIKRTASSSFWISLRLRIYMVRESKLIGYWLKTCDAAAMLCMWEGIYFEDVSTRRCDALLPLKIFFFLFLKVVIWGV
jgi:hypothetical protein